MANIADAIRLDLERLSANDNAWTWVSVTHKAVAKPPSEPNAGHSPLPPAPSAAMECRYCGRTYPSGTTGLCVSCGGTLRKA